MKKQNVLFSILLSVLILPAVISAEPLKKLAKELQKAAEKIPSAKVAVFNFPYSDGTISGGSSIVQERLTTYLVQGGAQVIERNLLVKLLEEKKLEAAGILDGKTTAELGKVLGANAVVTGTLNDLGNDKVEVNARLIAPETGNILAAAQAVIKKTWADAPAKPAAPPAASTAPAAGPFLGKPLVQIALLLDTSNSMDGLINQARAQLWKIANAFTSAEKNGKGPEVRLALYEYGNNTLSPDAGYLRQVIPFTTDLDSVSEKLFSLTTNGGDEYCGWAIKQAAADLSWDRHADVYKAMFVAGNEPFTQGPVNFMDAAKEAAAKGIIVNTIYCGDRQSGVATQWKTAADMTGGSYFNIDHNAPAAPRASPYDDDITALNAKLDGTYIPYGERAQEKYDLKSRQDKLAAGAAKSVSAERAAYKSSAQGMETESSWDLTSAIETGKLSVSEVDRQKLPKNLQTLKPEEQENYIRRQLQERRALRAELDKVKAKRQAYETEAAAKDSGAAEKTFEDAVSEALRSQAAKMGYVFKTN